MGESIFRFLRDLRANLRAADLLDIAVVALFVYFGLSWLRERRARPVALGIALTTLLFILARRLDMVLTSLVFQAGLTALLVALILIFQDDIRRVFERLATWGVSRDGRGVPASARTVDTLLEAVSILAGKKIGALIVVEGRESCERHIRGGVLVRGRASVYLLHSIFLPQAPGHDGAVLITGDRIEKLGVHLPLSRNLAEVGRAGTRHAAALGLAESCDALVIVVSEERGTISMAEQGRLTELENVSELKQRLSTYYARLFPARSPARLDWISRDLGAKLVALVLAGLLWLLFAYRVQTIQRTFEVPIEYRNLASGYDIARASSTQVQVTLSGSERVFDLLDPSTMVVSLDLGGIEPGPNRIHIAALDLHKPSGLAVSQIVPREVQLTIETPGR